MSTYTLMATDNFSLSMGTSVDVMNAYFKHLDVAPTTLRGHKNSLKQFFAYCSANSIDAPCQDDIKEYRDGLLANGCKVSTVTLYMRHLGQFFKYLDQQGIYQNIALGVKIPKASKEPSRDSFSIDSLKDIEQGLDDTTEQGARLKAMFLLASTDGLRTIELHRANVSDFERFPDHAILYVWGKGHQEADTRVYLPYEVAEAVTKYLAIRKDGSPKTAPLFVATGNRSGGKRIATTTISKMLKKAMQQAGYDSTRLTAHSLRHSAATNALKASNNNIYVVQQILRHSSPDVTMRYLHDQALEQQAEVLSRVSKAIAN